MKQYKFRINGNDYNVAINTITGNIADVTVNGTSYQVEMENTAVQSAPVSPAQTSVAASPASPAVPAPASGGKALTSPLPGVIIAIKVNVGDFVKAGQTVAVLEAMKMENDILAEKDGNVTSINVAEGDSVLEGAAIVTIA